MTDRRSSVLKLGSSSLKFGVRFRDGGRGTGVAASRETPNGFSRCSISRIAPVETGAQYFVDSGLPAWARSTQSLQHVKVEPDGDRPFRVV